MEKINEFERVENVEYIPHVIENNVLYISEKFGCSRHYCPCGCGTEINIPLKPFWHHGWDFKREPGDLITFTPSLLNTSCPNKAHYFVRQNKIIWC